MPIKIKIVFAVMAVAAGFLVYQFAQYVNRVANQGSFLQQGNPLPTADNDTDSDGLRDQMEVIWGTDPFNPDTDGDGFLDGEEVNSGHNPLIPGPDDLLSGDNLTMQFSELAAAGILAGDLQPESEAYETSLSQITDHVTDSGTYYFTKEITIKDFSVVASNESSIRQYVPVSTNLIKKFGENLTLQYDQLQNTFSQIESRGFIDPKLQDFYSKQKISYENMLTEGLSAKVPDSFAPAHAKFLTLIQQMRSVSDSILNGYKDPVKAAIAFDVFGSGYESFINVIMLLDKEYEKNGVSKEFLEFYLNE